MSEILDGAGVPIAYRRQGRGPAVVLVHGMAADALTWAPLAAALADRACVVTFDRRGYGASGAPEPYERTTVQEQAEDLAALLRELAPGAVVLGGADFGALVCLEVALRHPLRLAGLALFEPYAFNLVAAATEALSAQRAQLEQAIRDRGPGAAIETWLGERADEDRRQRAAARPRAFFADYAGLATWPVTRAELRSLAAPVAIVDGAFTPPHVRAAGDALAALVPAARRRRDGALAQALGELLVEPRETSGSAG